MIKLVRIADVISLINASCGFLALLVLFLDIVTPYSLKIRLAVTFIFIGLLADGLDGMIARKKGKGHLGEYIEPMADMSSLIIAPAFVVLFQYQGTASASIPLLLIFLSMILLYTTCGMIRLAAFHPLKNQNAFLGLPASAAACSLLLVSVFYASLLYILPIICIISFLMILPISFPKPSLKMNAIAAFLILTSLLLWDLLYTIGPLSLLLCILLYIFLGPLLQQKEHMERKKNT
jgi:CDP-diacylglycerol--serine O-phosphatidyltransferase